MGASAYRKLTRLQPSVKFPKLLVTNSNNEGDWLTWKLINAICERPSRKNHHLITHSHPPHFMSFFPKA